MKRSLEYHIAFLQHFRFMNKGISIGHGDLFSKKERPVPGNQRKVMGKAGGAPPGNRHESAFMEGTDEGPPPALAAPSCIAFPGSPSFLKRDPHDQCNHPSISKS